jgi:hypothetical protein
MRAAVLGPMPGSDSSSAGVAWLMSTLRSDSLPTLPAGWGLAVARDVHARPVPQRRGLVQRRRIGIRCRSARGGERVGDTRS